MLFAFVPPQTRVQSLAAGAATTRHSSVAMIEFPKMPKLDMGGIEFESFGDKWNGPGDLKLLPSDVQFRDVDGDTITLRGRPGGKVDYYVGKNLKLTGAVLQSTGSALQVTGSIKKGTPLSFLGFNLEETITDQMTPTDPEMIAKAMALV